MVAVLALLLATSGPVPFTLVNGTGGSITGISARRARSAGEWRPLERATLASGFRGNIPALGGEDCAWDIRADTGGQQVIWPDVNLCDVKVVTLRRRGGTLWVDYD